MPIRYAVHPKSRLVTSSFAGELTRQDVLDFCCELKSNPRFAPTFNELSEISAGAVAHFHYADLETIRTADPFSPESKRAFITYTDVDFGMARMYQMLAGGCVQVFRSVNDAMAFLDLSGV
jgi:hypothetical protein